MIDAANGLGSHFGPYGGQFVAETLMPLLSELEQAFNAIVPTDAFRREFHRLLRDYVGRPSPLTFAEKLTERLGGARLYLKREDLNHTGAHKINNCIGQALLAQAMGKRRIIAETGAGQHGVATATVCARLGFPCEVFMGEEDMARQSLNVFRMRLLGAKVTAVSAGSRTLKDAMNEALRDWVSNVDDTYYLIGSAAGPHPYPSIVREFQSVIGREVREQSLAALGRLPDVLIACVGGGSNAMGLFGPFLEEQTIRMIGVEAAGNGIASGRHAASLSAGSPGVFHGSYSYILQDPHGQVTPAHSISAGLDYPGVGPQLSHMKDTGRAEFVAVTDDEALAGLQLLARTEGIIPALESAHAVAYMSKLAPTLSSDTIVVLNLSGRGDKDMPTVSAALKL